MINFKILNEEDTFSIRGGENLIFKFQISESRFA